MFFGTYRHQIDQKGRMRVPPKLKAELQDGFIVTKGTNGCLFAFSKTEIEDGLFEKIKNLSLFDNEVQKPVRLLFSSAFQTEEDDQGRILISQELRRFAGLEKNIVFVGAGTRVEIWAEENWDKFEDVSNFDSAVSELKKQGV